MGPTTSAEKTGASYRPNAFTYPWVLPDTEVIEQEELRGATIELSPNQAFVTRRIKARVIMARVLENKSWQRLDPPAGGWRFFGYYNIPANVTEG